MPIRLGTNIDSLRAQSGLKRASSALASTFERLASGQRINHAADDAAGLSIASQLTARARVYNQAIRNLNDGISAASIAEGALNALRDIAQRQFELAEEAANGTYSKTQRKSLDAEANKLVDEFNRIVESTTFNGISLFDTNLGSITLQAGYGSAGTLSIGFTDQLGRLVGDGTFHAGQDIAGAGTERVTINDFNGDGNLDFAAIGSGTTVSIVLGNGDGTFRAANFITVSGGGMGFYPNITSGDVNGDGRVDLVSANNGNATVLIGRGDGTFNAPTTITPPAGAAQSAELADLNGDGRLDLLLGLSNGFVQSYLGNGDGTFRTSTSYATGGNYTQSMQVGDFNGDGKADAVAATYVNSVAIMLGTGNGSFSTFTLPATGGARTTSVVIGDYNRDGNQDIASADYNGYVSVYLGNGNGSFKAATTLTLAATGFDIKSGDLNGDGIDDIIANEYSGVFSTFISNGDGTFKASRTSSIFGYDFGLGDFNEDGVLDVLSAGTAGGSTVYIANTAAVAKTGYLNLLTQSSARNALDTISSTLNRVIGQIGSIGATTSRFASDISNLQVQRENFLAAAGRITDLDFADATADLTRQQILQQAAAAVLAQANQSSALALSLLN